MHRRAHGVRPHATRPFLSLLAAASLLALAPACGGDPHAPQSAELGGKGDAPSAGGITLSLTAPDSGQQSDRMSFAVRVDLRGASIDDPRGLAARFSANGELLRTRSLSLDATLGTTARPHYRPDGARATVADCVAGRPYYYWRNGQKVDQQYTAASYCGWAHASIFQSFAPGSHQLRVELQTTAAGTLAQPYVEHDVEVTTEAESGFGPISTSGRIYLHPDWTDLELERTGPAQVQLLPAGASRLRLTMRIDEVVGTPEMTIATDGPGGRIRESAAVSCSFGSGGKRYCWVSQWLAGLALDADFTATFTAGGAAQRTWRFATRSGDLCNADAECRAGEICAPDGRCQGSAD